jgi:predicted SAM-dependent methyltransferase
MRLNIGAGMRPLPGYVNVDRERYPGVDYALGEFVQLDVLESGFVAWLRARCWHAADPITEVRLEQFLEHLSIEQGVWLLRALLPFLTEDARVHITVPDFARHADDYRERVQRVPLRDPAIAAGLFRPEVNVLQRILYDWGHRAVYDEEILRIVLREGGYEPVEITRADGANVAATCRRLTT